MRRLKNTKYKNERFKNVKVDNILNKHKIISIYKNIKNEIRESKDLLLEIKWIFINNIKHALSER